MCSRRPMGNMGRVCVSVSVCVEYVCPITGHTGGTLHSNSQVKEFVVRGRRAAWGLFSHLHRISKMRKDQRFQLKVFRQADRLLVPL